MLEFVDDQIHNTKYTICQRCIDLIK
jgi:hypothetical protein